MFLTQSEYSSTNPALFEKIQQVYSEYFHPQIPYVCDLAYENVTKYGFPPLEKRTYQQKVAYTAEDYISYISIHSDHQTLQEPFKSNLFNGIRDAIISSGNTIVLNKTIVLYLTKKP